MALTDSDAFLARAEQHDAAAAAKKARNEQLANPPDRIGTLRDLHDAVRQKSPAPMQRIFDEAVRVYPKVVPKDTLAEKIGVNPTSGGYFNNLGRLRTLGLIDYPTPGDANNVSSRAAMKAREVRTRLTGSVGTR